MCPDGFLGWNFVNKLKCKKAYRIEIVPIHDYLVDIELVLQLTHLLSFAYHKIEISLVIP